MSFVARVSVLFAAVLVLVAATSTLASRFDLPAWQVFLLDLLVGLPLGLWLLARFLRPATAVIRALDDAFGSLGDQDYSVRLAPTRDDELGAFRNYCYRAALRPLFAAFDKADIDEANVRMYRLPDWDRIEAERDEVIADFPE